MNDFVLTDLPSGWYWERLEELCEKITDGTHHSPSNGPAGEYKYITAKNIKPWGLDLNNITYVDEPTHKEIYSRCDVKKNDVLFIKDGATTGEVVVNPLEEEFSLLSSVGVFRTNNKLDPYYLRYALMNPKIKKAILANMAGVAITRLTLKKLKAAKIPVAPLDQQKRIVAKIEELFSHIDAGIDALKKAKQLLKQYRQSVLKAAVTGELTKEWREANKDKLEPASKLLERILQERRKKWEAQQLEGFKAKGKVPKDEGWKEKYEELAPISNEESSNLPILPDSWIYTRLGNVIDEPNYGTSKKCSYDQSGTGVLRIPNVANGAIDSEDLKYAEFEESEIETYKLRQGDILTIRSNGSINLVGKCALIGEKETAYLYAGYLIRLRPNPVVVDGQYLINTFNSAFLRHQIESKAKSTSGVNNINSGELKSLVIPVCSKAEQLEISRFVEEKMSSADRLHKEIEGQIIKSDKNRQSILCSAFSGELV